VGEITALDAFGRRNRLAEMDEGCGLFLPGRDHYKAPFMKAIMHDD
jgi:hypothetical protein